MATPIFRSSVSFILVFQLLSAAAADSFCNVKYLPGFSGPLPFELETGYVGVGDSDEVQLFYYFVKSQTNPQTDPLLAWYNGGPGCSGLCGFLFEIGPLIFKSEPYNGSLPQLILNPHTWTKKANILFVDTPVGTGFSYNRTLHGSKKGTSLQVEQNHQFLRKWLANHPEFISNPFYVSGDSFAGIVIPPLTQAISEGNNHALPIINLQGYIEGDPVTIIATHTNFRIPFAHSKNLISDELYESLTTNCKGEYEDVDPENLECIKHVKTFKKEYKYYLGYYWANDDRVQKALHIREETIGEWVRCQSKKDYNNDIPNVVPYHANLSSKGYRSLIFSGDLDMMVPILDTEAWIKSLNYSIVDDWRPWFGMDDQVLGYTRTYANNMTFATIKGGGHTPEYMPYQSLLMFNRWIAGEPL